MHKAFKVVILVVFFALQLFFFQPTSYAIEDPLAVTNNKFGIHILFPEEIHDAAKLVNGNGGDWGYVTIPIQSGDKDIKKWQTFMDNAKRLHIIPIIRLATEGDYLDKKIWRKPSFQDITDFGQFLDLLSWPIKNRYIVLFNEVNRADEWGGQVNPLEYAQIVSYAVTVFKSKNQDFFILSSGLDAAVSQTPPASMNSYEYFKQMNESVPGIFYQIDGFASHSYPHPDFSQPPTKQDNQSVKSFQFEKEFIQSLANKELPVFITETGWSKKYLSEDLISSYYQTAFEEVWNDSSIVAVTPFLLKAHSGPFTVFSFTNLNASPSAQFTTIANLPKVKGNPILSPEPLQATESTSSSVLGEKTNMVASKEYSPIVRVKKAIDSLWELISFAIKKVAEFFIKI